MHFFCYASFGTVEKAQQGQAECLQCLRSRMTLSVTETGDSVPYINDMPPHTLVFRALDMSAFALLERASARPIRSAHQLLRLLEAKGSDCPDFLDDLDFRCSFIALQLYVKLCLFRLWLLDRFGRCCSNLLR